MYFYLFIITLVLFIWYIYKTYKTKEPVNWNKEGVTNPYNTYYKLVKLFGNPDAIDTNSKGTAIWDEDNLKDHKLASDNSIVRLELIDIPSNFLIVSFTKTLSDGDYTSIRKKIPAMYDSINNVLKIQGNDINEIVTSFKAI